MTWLVTGAHVCHIRCTCTPPTHIHVHVHAHVFYCAHACTQHTHSQDRPTQRKATTVDKEADVR